MLASRVQRLEEFVMQQERRINKLESENRLIRAAFSAMVHDNIGQRGMSLIGGQGSSPLGGGGVPPSVLRQLSQVREGTSSQEEYESDSAASASDAVTAYLSSAALDEQSAAGGAASSADNSPARQRRRPRRRAADDDGNDDNDDDDDDDDDDDNVDESDGQDENDENVWNGLAELGGGASPPPPLLSAESGATKAVGGAGGAAPYAHATFCDTCRHWYNSPRQYDDHFASKRHRRAAELAAARAAGTEPSAATALATGPTTFEAVWAEAAWAGLGDDADGDDGGDLARDVAAVVAEHADQDAGDAVSRGSANGVLLYYRYCRLGERAAAVRDWQDRLCRVLRLTGRIRVAPEGINGTVGGAPAALRVYRRAMTRHPALGLADDDFKTGLGSDGGAHSFPNLWVKLCREIVVLGIDPAELPPHAADNHLSPAEWHRVLSEGPRADTVLLDCRNFYESRVGRFEFAAGNAGDDACPPIAEGDAAAGALLTRQLCASARVSPSVLAPQTRQFSDFPAMADALIDAYGLRDKRVLMYCTGGIRCERGSAYLRQRGVERVYQLHGGIHRYLEAFPDARADSRFRGQLFVFDRRVVVTNGDGGGDAVAAGPAKLGQCDACHMDASCDRYDTTLRCSQCRVLCLVCEACRPRVKQQQQEEQQSSHGGGAAPARSSVDGIGIIPLRCPVCIVRGRLPPASASTTDEQN